MASIFGHPLVVNIHDYLLLLVVTSLECIVTLTPNNSNCFLDPICAVHLEMSRQFVASVFGHPLVVNIHDYLLLLVVITSLECIVTTSNSNL